MFIANGITGVRDMGSDLDAVLDARAARSGSIGSIGPRMVVSGPMLDGPKVAVRGVDRDRDAETTVARPSTCSRTRGVDFIKVQSGVPRDAYFAIASEAEKEGIVFEGHVPDAIRASEAIAAGQRTFEHLIGIFEASTPDETSFIERRYGAGKDSSPTRASPRFSIATTRRREASIIQLIAKNVIWQCPTLFWERGQWLVDAIDYAKDPDLAFTPRTWIDKKYPSMRKSILKEASTPIRSPCAERFVQHELDIVRKLHAAGVPFLAGTDTPAGVDVSPGISLHLELQRFVAAGFTPLEALQTATRNPAIFFLKLADFGTVAEGKVADLVLLDANPLDDIRNTRKIAAVVANGRLYAREDLDRILEGVEQFARGH